MAKDLACVEGSRRNTGKEVVITERKGHWTDKKRNLKITTGHSAWWNQLRYIFLYGEVVGPQTSKEERKTTSV